MRGLRQEDAVSDAVDAAEEKWPRALDAWDAVTWAIARDPDSGTPLTESGNLRVLVFHGARSIEMPSVTVTYETGNPTITIVDAEFEDAPYGQAGHS